MLWFLALLYSFAGGSYYLLSGAAEGFVSPRFGPFLLALVAGIHTATIIARVIARLFGYRFSLTAAHFAVVSGFIFALVGILMGMWLDDERIEESMRRGDAIAAQAGAFQALHGRCPANIGELNGIDVAIQKPALEKSEFYFYENTDGCYLGFKSVLFMNCERSLASGEWICDD